MFLIALWLLFLGFYDRNKTQARKLIAKYFLPLPN